MSRILSSTCVKTEAWEVETVVMMPVVFFFQRRKTVVWETILCFSVEKTWGSSRQEPSDESGNKDTWRLTKPKQYFVPNFLEKEQRFFKGLICLFVKKKNSSRMLHSIHLCPLKPGLKEYCGLWTLCELIWSRPNGLTRKLLLVFLSRFWVFIFSIYFYQCGYVIIVGFLYSYLLLLFIIFLLCDKNYLLQNFPCFKQLFIL